MASFKSQPLPLETPEECRVWLIAFEAHCRGKKLTDDPTDDASSPQTDNFLERCGSKALLKIISMLPGRDITKLKYADLRKVVLEYVDPSKRLVIAERTNFLQLSQDKDE